MPCEQKQKQTQNPKKNFQNVFCLKTKQNTKSKKRQRKATCSRRARHFDKVEANGDTGIKTS